MKPQKIYITITRLIGFRDMTIFFFRTGSPALHPWRLLAHVLGDEFPGDRDADKMRGEGKRKVRPLLAVRHAAGVLRGHSGLYCTSFVTQYIFSPQALHLIDRNDQWFTESSADSKSVAISMLFAVCVQPKSSYFSFRSPSWTSPTSPTGTCPSSGWCAATPSGPSSTSTSPRGRTSGCQIRLIHLSGEVPNH